MLHPERLQKLFIGVLLWGIAAATACSILLFPLWKEQPVMFLPVSAGILMYLLSRRCVPGCARRLMQVSDRTFWVCLLGGSLLFQIMILWILRPEPVSDGLFVFRQAVSLSETGQFDPLTYYPPLQILYYRMFLWLPVPPVLAVQLSHIPLWLGILYVSGRLAAGIYNQTAGRLTAVVLACYPGLSTYILSTPYYLYLYTLLLLLMLGCLIRIIKRPEVNPGLKAFAGGCAGAAAALTKAVMLLSPLLAFFFFCLVPGLGRAVRVRAMLFFCLGFIMVWSPWVWRNMTVFDTFVPVCTSGPLVLYSANNPESDGLYSAVPDQATITTPQDMLEHGDACREKALQFMTAQPQRFFSLAAKKIIFTWGNEATFTERVNIRGRPLPQLLDLVWGALVQAMWVFVFCLFAAGLYRHPDAALMVFTGLLLCLQLAVYAVFEGGARHHLPAVPFMLLIAAAAIRSVDVLPTVSVKQ